MTTTPDQLAEEVVRLHISGGWSERQVPFVRWFAPRVEAGAAFLDQLVPDWPSIILDADEFRMASAHSCVLGHTANALTARLDNAALRTVVADYHGGAVGSAHFHSIHYLAARVFQVDPEQPNTLAGDHLMQALGFTVLDAAYAERAGDYDSRIDDNDTQAITWGVLGDLWLLQARRRLPLSSAEVDELRDRRAELVVALEVNTAELAEIDDRLAQAGVTP